MYKRICVGYIKCGKDIWRCNQKFELGKLEVREAHVG